MILISASDNDSSRYYRLRGLATIRAWAYALRTCSDATLGRATNSPPRSEQPGVSHPLIPASGQHRKVKPARQV